MLQLTPILEISQGLANGPTKFSNQIFKKCKCSLFFDELPSPVAN